MPRTRHFLLAALALAIGLPLLEARPREVANFMLIDHRGEAHELRRTGGRAVVLFFTGNGCPVARQATAKLLDLQARYRDRGVTLLLVNSNTGDDRPGIAGEARELGAWDLPVLHDDTHGVARHLGVQRTGEAVAIRTDDWSVFYRGAIDDQFVEGAGKPSVGRAHLAEALDALLTDRPVEVPTTTARGCRIFSEADAKWAGREVSYTSEVAPILRAKCVDCHSRGNIGSWVMSGHRKVRSMASMIEEVILTRRMPPWDADPHVGQLAGATALTVSEAQTLLHWIGQGAPRGDGPDPLDGLEVPPAPDWPLGPPDIVLRLPRPEVIPATGVLDYRHVEVRLTNETPAWVRATWVKPGNRRVLHHVIARLKEGGFTDNLGQDEMYVGWAPGTALGDFPRGTGKYLPPGARFDLELHYTPCGSEQTDATEIGLYLADEKPGRRYESVPVIQTDFEIPPGNPRAEVTAHYSFDRPATLHSVTPHMHLRGRSMRFEVEFPDGRRETVCSVPRYDFNWQLTYPLAEPLRLPAGTRVRLVGTFDNSPGNPSNPDPTVAVHWGEQSWEEMFLGWYNVEWDEPFTPPPPRARRERAGR